MDFEPIKAARDLLDSLAQEEILVSPDFLESEMQHIMLNKILDRIGILVMRMKVGTDFNVTSFGRISTICTLAQGLIRNDSRFSETVKGYATAAFGYKCVVERSMEECAVIILEYYAQELLNHQPPALRERDVKAQLVSLKSKSGEYQSTTIMAFIATMSILINGDGRFTHAARDNIMDFIIENWNPIEGFRMNVVVLRRNTADVEHLWWAHPFTTLKRMVAQLTGDESHNLRFFHRGKTLFYSTCAKKKIGQLFRAGDTLYIEEIANQANNDTKRETTASIETTASTAMKIKRGSLKSKRQHLVTPPMTLEDYIERHSLKMTKVFEEIEPILKERKKTLNNNALQRSRPKEKDRATAQNSIQTLVSVDETLALEPEAKAGKSRYPVLVGDPNNLYRSRKGLRIDKPISVIDLHGFSSQEAIAVLDVTLADLLIEAMMSEPWVVPVDIVCGCGTQALSNVVERWIKSQKTVANRPKSF